MVRDMYNIYNIYTYPLCVDSIVSEMRLCLLLAAHCVYFYRVLVHIVMSDIYTGCMWIATV